MNDSFQKIDKKLLKMSRKAATSDGRKALRKGAILFRIAVRAEAPVRSGLLRRNIKVKGMKSQAGSLKLKVDTGAFKGPSFYVGFILYGWKHGSRKLGDKRKSIKANDFLSRAFNSTKSSAVDAVKDTWKSLILTGWWD